MAKTSKVPSGFFSGREAARRLKMATGTFYKQVRAGKITKNTPAGSSEGFYSKEEIEKMAQAKELFILLYSIEPILFTRASSEEDVRGIVDMCVAIYGVGGTPSYETRLAIWRACPDAYYVLKQEDIVVGYVSLIWFDEEALASLMGPSPKHLVASSAGTGVYSMTGPEHVIPFTSGAPIDSVFISLAVRPGMSNQQQREYGFRLLRSVVEVLEDFARRGMAVRHIYATSERTDGISLARKLGMQETRYGSDTLRRYHLDLETSNAPMAVTYRRALSQNRE